MRAELFMITFLDSFFFFLVSVSKWFNKSVMMNIRFPDILHDFFFVENQKKLTNFT